LRTRGGIQTLVAFACTSSIPPYSPGVHVSRGSYQFCVIQKVFRVGFVWLKNAGWKFSNWNICKRHFVSNQHTTVVCNLVIIYSLIDLLGNWFLDVWTHTYIISNDVNLLYGNILQRHQRQCLLDFVTFITHYKSISKFVYCSTEAFIMWKQSGILIVRTGPLKLHHFIFIILL